MTHNRLVTTNNNQSFTVHSSPNSTTTTLVAVKDSEDKSVRQRAYLFSTRHTEPYGRIESIEWSSGSSTNFQGSTIYPTTSGKLHMQTTTIKNHR